LISLTWQFDFLDPVDFNSLVCNILTLSVPTGKSLQKRFYVVSFTVILRFVDIEEIVDHRSDFLLIFTSPLRSLNIYIANQ
jgi:hypothetical protein